MARPSSCRTAWLGLAILVVTACFPRLALAQEVRYFYDALNRLIGVMDPQGHVAEYVYDPVGNLLQIRRLTATISGSVAIFLVRPTQGTPHTAVEIYGQGFSPVPAENQVSFNGTSATVTASTETALVTAVPAGATTGPLTVTTPLGNATTVDPFTVLGDFVLVPDQADVALGATLGFQARLNGTPTEAVTWRVNGVVGGNALFGTITPEGYYTAPATRPPIQPVHVEAVRADNPAWVAPARVGVDEPGGVTVPSALSVAVAAAVSGSAAAGAVSLHVTQAGEAHALAGPVSVAAVASPGKPALGGRLSVTGGAAILAVTPATGAPGSAIEVTLAGRNFQGATAISAVRNGLVDGTIVATAIVPTPDGTAVTCTLTIGAAAPLGSRVLQVVTPQGRSTPFDLGTNRLTVTSP